MSNIVIIGSGPAGVSAALYTARAGVDTTVLTRGPGALDRAELIQNYYGFAEGVTFQQDFTFSKGVKSAAKQQIGGERKCG